MIVLTYPFVVKFVTDDKVEILRDVEYFSPVDAEPDFVGFASEAEVTQYIDNNSLMIFTPEDSD